MCTKSEVWTQDLEMQLAEQKSQWLSAGNVDTSGLHLQQDLTMMRQQLQDEEASLQQLAQSISSVKQKAALVSDPEQLANLKTR